MVYFFASTAIFIVGLLIVYWLHSQAHLDIVVTPAAPPAAAPLISVCVPARNEERNIGRCVESILAQDYPNFEVIVLDDRSTDRTPEILSAIGSLEEVEFDSCAGLTTAGIAALARLPGLRQVRVSGMRGVTAEVAAAFGPGVKVRYAV